MPRHNCCGNYTRSQLMRESVARAAEAGKGLPAIETGMPVPAGHRALAPLLPVAQRRPGPGRLRRDEAAAGGLRGGHRPRGHQRQGPRLDLLRRRHRLDERARPDRALPVRRPAADPGAPARPDPGVQRGHRACSGTPPRTGSRTLHAEGKVSTFPAIGYTSPNQSHFTSRHFYEIGELEIGGTHRLAGPLPRPHGQRRQPAPGAVAGRQPLPLARHRSTSRSPRSRRHRLRHVDPRRGRSGRGQDVQRLRPLRRASPRTRPQ